MRTVLLSASAALVAGVTVASLAVPAFADTPAGVACTKAAAAKSLKQARADLKTAVGYSGEFLDGIDDSLSGSMPDTQAAAYQRVVGSLRHTVQHDFSNSAIGKLKNIAAVRARTTEWASVSTEISDVEMSVSLAESIYGGYPTLSASDSQQLSTMLDALQPSELKTGATNALARMPQDAQAVAADVGPAFDRLAHLAYTRSAAVEAAQDAIAEKLFADKVVLPYLVDVGVIEQALPDLDADRALSPAVGRALAARRVLADARRTVTQKPLSTCDRLALLPGKDGLNGSVDETVSQMHLAYRALRSVGLPASQVAGYRHTVGVLDTLHTKTFSHSAVNRLRSKAQVKALTARWKKVVRRYTDVTDAMQRAILAQLELSPAVLGTYTSVFQAVLDDRASLGFDETVGNAALARIPAEQAALAVAARPALDALARADYGSHTQVVAREKALADELANSPEGRALATDGAVVSTAAPLPTFGGGVTSVASSRMPSFLVAR